MKLLDVISLDAIHNIVYHCKKCWDYTYPTSTALEEAIYRGLKPFYNDPKSLGAPNTIVDVSKEKDAFDVKGGKKLGHLKKLTKSANFDENIFAEQILPNALKIKVRIPKNIMTMVRRPNVDMENWVGDPLSIINKSIGDYEKFANGTTKKSGCDTLYTIVVLYGEDQEKGYRSIFLTLEDFSVPEIKDAKLLLGEDGKSKGYLGLDSDGNLNYRLSRFNRGSVNSDKRFDTSRGILYTWPIEVAEEYVGKLEDLLKDGAIRTIL